VFAVSMVSAKTTIKVIKKRKLSLLGELNSQINDIISETMDFVGDCYGVPEGITMSDTRQAILLFWYNIFITYVCFQIQNVDQESPGNTFKCTKIIQFISNIRMYLAKCLQSSL